MASKAITQLHINATDIINDQLIIFQDETRKQTLIEWANTMERMDIGCTLELAIKLTRSQASRIGSEFNQ